jgi:hypothetical protein
MSDSLAHFLLALFGNARPMDAGPFPQSSKIGGNDWVLGPKLTIQEHRGSLSSKIGLNYRFSGSKLTFQNIKKRTNFLSPHDGRRFSSSYQS